MKMLTGAMERPIPHSTTVVPTFMRPPNDPINSPMASSTSGHFALNHPSQSVNPPKKRNEKNQPERMNEINNGAVMENATITTATMTSPAIVIDEEKRPAAKHGITQDKPGDPAKIQVLKVVNLFLRFLTFVFSVGALMLVVTDRQAISANYFGIPFRARADWTSATAFEYEAAIAAVASLYSLVQLNLELFMYLLGKSGPRKYAWIQLLLDQVAAYLLATSGAAAASLANLNLNSLKGAPLPVIRVCDFLHHYCYQAFLAVGFTFAAFVLSAHVVFLDIYFLCGK